MRVDINEARSKLILIDTHVYYQTYPARVISSPAYSMLLPGQPSHVVKPANEQGSMHYSTFDLTVAFLLLDTVKFYRNKKKLIFNRPYQL